MTLAQTQTKVNPKSEPILPQDYECETRVLSGCIHAASDHVIANVRLILKVDHFYREDHRLIYQALLDIFESGELCQLIPLRNRLIAKGELEAVGGDAYLERIVASDYNAVNIEFYARQVMNCAILRNLIGAAGQIKTMAYDPGTEPSEVIEQAEKMTLAASSDLHSTQTVNIKEAAPQVVSEIQQRKKGGLRGSSTGFVKLDQKLHGLKAGDLIVIGGRTSMGKTAVALNIAEYLAVDCQEPVGFVSLEMTADALIERIIVGRGHLDNDRTQGGYLNESELETLQRVGEEVASSPLYIEPPYNMTPLLLRSKARRLVMRYGIKCLFLDYLQLLRSPGKQRDRYLEIGEWTSSLKSLALELNIPIVVMSQLNRASEDKERPRLSSLRESGNIEQDADVVLLLYREGYYKTPREDRGTAEVIIAKNRNGPTGTVKLAWIGEWMRFEDYSNVLEPAS